jgi:hypothetical protein
MPINKKKTKSKNKKSITKKKISKKDKNIHKKRKSSIKKEKINTNVINTKNIDNDTNIIDNDTSIDDFVSLNDMSKAGILEYLKNKLLQNVLKIRYTYLTWFNRFGRNYELVDFLTYYIKAFLQLNNATVNEMYLYIRNNNIKNYDDFNDHIYLKNKILLLREKIIDSLDKYIIKGAPPQYYTDINDIFGLRKKIYVLEPSLDYPDNIKKDILKEVDEKIKNIKSTNIPPPPANIPPFTPPDLPPPPPADIVLQSDDIATLPPADIPPPPTDINILPPADIQQQDDIATLPPVDIQQSSGNNFSYNMLKKNKLNSLYDVFN